MATLEIGRVRIFGPYEHPDGFQLKISCGDVSKVKTFKELKSANDFIRLVKESPDKDHTGVIAAYKKKHKRHPDDPSRTDREATRIASLDTLPTVLEQYGICVPPRRRDNQSEWWSELLQNVAEAYLTHGGRELKTVCDTLGRLAGTASRFSPIERMRQQLEELQLLLDGTVVVDEEAERIAKKWLRTNLTWFEKHGNFDLTNYLFETKHPFLNVFFESIEN
jgi:hypothetical protein